MRTRMFRRGGTAALFLASVGAAVFGFTTTASAAVVEVEYLNANVKISGDAAVALNKCINDAKDNGVINTQQNACEQTATAANMVQLNDVYVYVWQGGWTWRYFKASYDSADVLVTGGAVEAINLCLNDAKDNGVINTQQNACKQTATAGNMVTLSNVGIEVATEQ